MLIDVFFHMQSIYPKEGALWTGVVAWTDVNNLVNQCKTNKYKLLNVKRQMENHLPFYISMDFNRISISFLVR